MSKKLLILIAAAVIILGGGATAVVMLMGGEEESADAEEQKVDQKAGLVPLKTFIVNLNDPGADRYVKVEVQLTIAPETLAQEIVDDELTIVRFRDRIVTLLSSKTYTELSKPLGKETLRREIKARLVPLVEEGEIQDVLFSDFVVQ
jgi:flagellar FliL protein